MLQPNPLGDLRIGLRTGADGEIPRPGVMRDNRAGALLRVELELFAGVMSANQSRDRQGVPRERSVVTWRDDFGVA